MAEQHAPRKLAAILAGDVVGYSRLTGADEEGTLARLGALRRELLWPSIAHNRGRIFKTTGDGILVEFQSVVDAVRHALEAQRGMAARNELVAPDQRIELRIGINLGDVVVEGDDLLGDGVNVAARLEAIAEPGGVVLSSAAFDQVEGKLDIAFEDMGEQSLKNIARPVRTYRIGPGASRPGAAAGAAPAARRCSVVVLPFADLSGNVADDYFVDAITEDITTDLSRIPDSFVIARNTAFTYKGKPVDAKQVGHELGVRYVLEGSVRRGGSRVRTNVQLIDAESGAHLFAERFDCDRADLMDVQDEIVGRIAGAVGAQLIDAESRRSIKERPTDPDAIDLTMRGWAVLHRPPSRESLVEARALFEQGLALDERAADAVIGLAYAYARGINSAFTDTIEADLARGNELVAKALVLAPDRAPTHWVRGLLLRHPKRYAEAAAAFEQAIALDRNFAPAYGSLGDLMTWLGRPEETIRLNEQAMRLSPRDPQLANWQFDIGFAHWVLGDDNQATLWLQRARSANPQLPFVPILLCAINAHQGKLDVARSELNQAQQRASWLTCVARVRAIVPVDDPIVLGWTERLCRGLALAGLPEE